MSCDCCDCSLVNGYYKCSNNDYRVVDENEDLINIIEEHEIDDNDEEINTKEKIKYCNHCNKIFRYPDTYENNCFKCSDNIFKYHDNHKNDNIIHTFNNIDCNYCNTLLEKGYYTNTEMEQTEENLMKYSYPNNFINTIHIYNEETKNKIKDIDIDLPELEIPETEIGKKIIYCPNCNFFITNKLIKIYKSD